MLANVPWMRMRHHPVPKPGAPEYNIELFQYFPKYSIIGPATAVQGQFHVTAPTSVVKQVAVHAGVGGTQNGMFGQGALYNPSTQRVGNVSQVGRGNGI